MADQFRNFSIWLYVRRYKIGYWLLVTFFFVVESAIGEFRVSGALLWIGILWWLYNKYRSGLARSPSHERDLIWGFNSLRVAKVVGALLLVFLATALVFGVIAALSQ